MTRGLWRLRDPLYGVVYLEQDEVALMKLPELQRLRYIRMCNINSLLISGASETKRFEHSIGVLWLAKEWLRHNPSSFSAEDRKVLRYAALLHDIQTGPFGHSFQYLIEEGNRNLNFQHSNIVAGEIQKFYQQGTTYMSFSDAPFNSKELLGDLWERVGHAIDGSGPVGALISSSIDIDNVDNVYRMAYHMGILGDDERHNPIKLIRELRILPDGGLSVTRDGIPLVQNWHEVRARVYNDLLLDWADFSAKAMLTRAMEFALEKGIIRIEDWMRTDDGLLDELVRKGKGKNQELGEIVKRLRTGNLYEPLGLYAAINNSHVKSLNTYDKKRDIEISLQKALSDAGLDIPNPLIHFIEDKNKTYRSVALKVHNSYDTVVIGETLDRMLVGVLVPKSVEKLRKLVVYKRLCEKVLRDYGIELLSEVEDPLHELDNNGYSGGLFS